MKIHSIHTLRLAFRNKGVKISDDSKRTLYNFLTKHEWRNGKRYDDIDFPLELDWVIDFFNEIINARAVIVVKDTDIEIFKTCCRLIKLVIAKYEQEHKNTKEIKEKIREELEKTYQLELERKLIVFETTLKQEIVQAVKEQYNLTIIL